ADLHAFCEGRPVSARRRAWWDQIRGVLNRRHLDTQRRGWTPLLLLFGVTILIGCVVCNYWEINRPDRAWLPILLTKAVQVTIMLFLAVRLRPAPEWTPGAAGGAGERPAHPPAPGLTAAERQMWRLGPGYSGRVSTSG